MAKDINRYTVEIINSITTREANLLTQHGHPSIAKAGLVLLNMCIRHDRNDYNRSMDAQNTDDVMFLSDGEEITKALNEMKEIDKQKRTKEHNQQLRARNIALGLE